MNRWRSRCTIQPSTSPASGASPLGRTSEATPAASPVRNAARYDGRAANFTNAATVSITLSVNSGSVCMKRASRKNGGQNSASTNAIAPARRAPVTCAAVQPASSAVPLSNSPCANTTPTRPGPNTWCSPASTIGQPGGFHTHGPPRAQ